ncbi:MAG: MmgE/PrpD family protein [Polyangiaceae bacterium]|nr:MmgE/PrpD family protein [Polyangiaceae bacterium]
MQAAYFARAGMTGALDVIEDRRGFWHRFSYLPLPSMMGGLGELWTTQTLTVKTVPGCHYFQTACEAVDAIEARRGRVDPARVRRVTLHTTKLALEATRFASEYARTTGDVTPVNVNFDLAVTVAIRLLAGRLASDEMHPGWLAARSADVRALAARTRVAHDPALTLATIDSLRAIPAGRDALKALRLADVPRLRRRYAEEYRSSLLPAAEAIGWLRALAGRRARGQEGGGAAPAPASAIPLSFPNRVTLEFDDGSTDSAQVDLPAGSFCSPGMESALRGKFMREVSPALGAQRAADAFAAGLALEATGLAAFVRQVTRPSA